MIKHPNELYTVFIIPFYTNIEIQQQQQSLLFPSKLGWGRLEMKPYEQKKNRYKIREKKMRKQRAIKKQNKKRRKDNTTLSQKSEKGVGKKNLTKGNKRVEPKIKILAHEFLASTLSYLMLAPW
jgi:hypothetical protein